MTKSYQVFYWIKANRQELLDQLQEARIRINKAQKMGEVL